MTRFFAILLLLGGCTVADDASAPDGSQGSGWDFRDGVDAGADDMPDDGRPDIPVGVIQLALGSRNVPFTAWADGTEVVIVHGPQGGVHTEHSAQARGASVDELHLATIWAEVWRDDVVLARAGWEFWNEQWQPAGDGYSVELPPLVFDDEPELGPVDLRGSIELTDGRTADCEAHLVLVDAPP